MSEYTGDLLNALFAVSQAQRETGRVWVSIQEVTEAHPCFEGTAIIQRQLEHGISEGLCLNPEGGSKRIWKLRPKGEELV